MVPSSIGPIRIVRRLGEGGMGVVYEGVYESIDRRVAVKVLHSEYAKNEGVTARFFNEARAVNRIEHPGIVQVSDYAQLPDGTAYIVMELLKGESLASRMHRLGGRLPLGSVLQITWQIADAIAAAHEKGIIHRDLKPENVMLVEDKVAPGGERAKILDFGIAKLMTNVQGSQVKTSAGAILGTPRYMAPEQCRDSGQVDGKADVYALGVMLYEMLAGRPPFDGPGLELLAMHLYQSPPPLKDLAPDPPDELISLVHLLLSKDKNLRLPMSGVFSELGRLHTQSLAETIHLEPDPQIPPKPMDVPPRAKQFLPKAVAVTCGAVAVIMLGTFAGVHMAASPAPAAPQLSAPQTVRWSVSSTPPGADIIRVRDGKKLGKTPWSSQIQPAQGTEEIKLRLSGYEERSIILHSGGHEQAHEMLDPMPPAILVTTTSPQAALPQKEPRRTLPKQPSSSTKPPAPSPYEVSRDRGTVQPED